MIRTPFFCVSLAVLLAGCPPAPGTDAGADAGLDGGAGVDGGWDAGSDAGTDFVWPVPTGPISITPHASWQNRQPVPSDPFLTSSNSGSNIRWVKFTVLMRDPTKVYFQNSRTYPMHTPFAIQRLDPFVGMTAEQYEAVSLHAAGQEAITGAVLVGPRGTEIGVQLVRLDPYPKEMVKIVYDLVVASLDSMAPIQSFYMPVFEQQARAKQDRAWLEAHGVAVSSPDRWTEGSVCYSTGWALGRLVQVAPAEIDAAYGDGRLTVNDVLLTESVPAEVPPVAGIVTLSASTPNSHVALLSTTLGIPFVYTPHALDVSRLQGLAGKQVLLRATQPWGGCVLDVFDATGLDPTVRAALLALKVPPALNLPPKQRRGAWSASTDGLNRSDVPFFGGKAAHYGLLRRAVPNDSYPAVALSFDLWDDAMAQPVSTGRTLREEIDLRLAPISTWPPANLANVKATLLSLRTFIVAEARLSPQAEAGVRAALTSFDPMKGIRFRSSTNVEDTDEFTGAGLYDSATGCLADDDDGDPVGPSRCNPGKPDERGVFLALRRVFASFYNDNAYLERLRHRVDERQVGMAVLVHASVPDELELANGVATLFERGGSSRDLKIVTQLGADSVTNPTGASVPEVVSGYTFGSSWYYEQLSGSSRVPLGAWVMDMSADYDALGALVSRVGTEYALQVARPFSLDFEFKKQIPGGKLWLKQVRPLPLPDTVPSVVPFVLHRELRLCVSQGELGNVVSLHRNRVRFAPVFRDVRLTDAERLQTLLRSADVTLVDGDAEQTLSGAPASWPNFSHGQSMDALLDSFSFGAGATARTVELSVTAPRLLAPSTPPILTAPELWFGLRSVWAQPQAIVAPYVGAPDQVTEESVGLSTCPEDEVITPAHQRQERTMSSAGIAVRTSFYWPPPPTGITAGYTAPNVKWEATDITGLTTAPLHLTADFAQTYRPGHHNFSEDFLFDPLRDPATTPAQRVELMTRNVRWLIISNFSPGNVELRAMGFDGVIRRLP